MKKFLYPKLPFTLAVIWAVFFCCCRNFSPENTIPAVTGFDLNRYMGKWYEIARMPHNFESNVTDAQAVYTLEEDGTVIVENSGFIDQKPTFAHAVARQGNSPNTGVLEVSFFYPFYSLYKIIYLNEDYTLAIVTGNSMDYLWILARKPLISKSELDMCLDKLDKWGYAVKLLQYPSGTIKSIMSGENN